MLTSSSNSTRRERFRRYRRTRPFWGGVQLIASAAFIVLPPLSSFHVGDVLLSVSTIAGVSTLLLGTLMSLCAFFVLTSPHARVPGGVVAMILALVALPAANFGGYLVGTLVGVTGSAAVLAWQPDRTEVSDG
ncbi:DUF6114 domain-containing protein [Rhodococcus sp. Eu-32]|uniref:DUF6114 domain-containing protein n=1 Tax=Rhodococcus sp. Eu-32 TaxID=1017319 RepID=UPI0024365131|nr:DUF6114 domain-containing protein [Rhodococcus sp. Eu-32]